MRNGNGGISLIGINNNKTNILHNELLTFSCQERWVSGKMTYTKDYMGERLQVILPYTFHFDLIPDERKKSGSRFESAFESMVNDLMKLKPYKTKKIKKFQLKV